MRSRSSRRRVPARPRRLSCPPLEPRHRAGAGKGASSHGDSPLGPRWHSSRRSRDTPREGVCDDEKARAGAPSPGRPPSAPWAAGGTPLARLTTVTRAPGLPAARSRPLGSVGGEPEAAEGGAPGRLGRRSREAAAETPPPSLSRFSYWFLFSSPPISYSRRKWSVFLRFVERREVSGQRLV